MTWNNRNSLKNQFFCAAALSALTLVAPGVRAQSPVGVTPGVNANINKDERFKSVFWEQKLNADLPLDTTFQDENGQPVQLAQFFSGKKPVILVMPFYACQGACTVELNGLLAAMNNMKYDLGKDFEVVVVSIDPREQTKKTADGTKTLAAGKKAEYLSLYNRQGDALTAATNGWHFLTGEQSAITRVTDTVGFHYWFDTKRDQYNHPAGLVILTPQGKVSKYVLNTAFQPTDLGLNLHEASGNKIGTLVDDFKLLCSQYDPTTGRYGLLVMRLIQVAGVATLVILGTSIGLMSLHHRRQALRTPPRLPGRNR